MERATPFGPPAFEKCGIDSQLSQIKARLSEGVTKQPAPAIRLRSPSPSLAAPKVGSVAESTDSLLLPSAFKPIFLTKSLAYVKLGSGWHLPKSGRGSHRIKQDSGRPSSSTKTRRAKGPPAPCIPSYKIENPGRFANSFNESKSKHSFSVLKYSLNGSIIVTVDASVNWYVVPTDASKLISSNPSTVLKDWISKLLSQRASVKSSPAGCPKPSLYLIPKSSPGPPGL
mmetsp:Transcript_12028/g.18456  ORF Transcript_12028/g.18456 Transcript_12028/m.18456 type:complete len:228 (-) Transcript_12028:603-1286(-)